MAWIWLGLAGVFEIAWALSLQQTRGFTHLGWSLGTGVLLLLSIGCLGVALRQLPLGTAYAVWTGVGTLGTVLIGMLWLGESASAWRIACIALILLGVAGLKWAPG